MLLLVAFLLPSSQNRLELFEDALKAVELLPAFLAFGSAAAKALPEPAIAAEWVKTSSAAKWKTVRAGLLLLIARHAGLIVNLTLLRVTHSLVRRINFSELLLRSCIFVDVWVVLLRQFEVRFLYFVLRGGAPHA